MRAALNLDDPGSGAVEELCEFAGHDTTAENDDGFREGIEIKDVVAGPNAFSIESGDVGKVNDRACSEDKMFGGNVFT